MSEPLLDEISQLSIPERIQLIEEVWDSISTAGAEVPGSPGGRDLLWQWIGLYQRRAGSAVPVETLRTLEMIAVRREYMMELRRWADEVAETLAASASYCFLDPQKTSEKNTFKERYTLITRLYALIDRGRWFVVDEHPELFATGQYPPYRGLRTEVLNLVIHVLLELQQASFTRKEENSIRLERIKAEQRQFVGHMQKILDPREVEADLRRWRL